MLALHCLVSILIMPFKSKSRLEAENVALRHQVMVLRRQVGGRVYLTNLDRLFLVQLYHWFPSIRRVLAIIRPETVVRWHRAGFRCYWRWKSRSRGGRRRSLRNCDGERRAFTASFLSLALTSPSRRWPNTWPSGMDRQVRDGTPSCATTRRTLLPWTCSLSRALVSTCSIPSSSSGWTGGSSSGSTLQQIRRLNGLHAS